MFAFPDWVPMQVREILCSISSVQQTNEARAIVARLAVDDRMKVVWKELFKRNRDSGNYFHLARSNQPQASVTNDQVQLIAVLDLLRIAVAAARDKRSVTKPEEVNAANERLKMQSIWLRGLATEIESVIASGQLGIVEQAKEVKPEHFLALRHVADWLDSFAGVLRKANDPLMVSKIRGDPVARAVHITLSDVCEKDHFGERLDGTMATIASVAVGASSSKRASRSALSKTKSTKEAENSKPRRRGSFVMPPRTE